MKQAAKTLYDWLWESVSPDLGLPRWVALFVLGMLLADVAGLGPDH